MSQFNISTFKYFKNKKHVILKKKLKKKKKPNHVFPLNLPCLSSESYPLRGSGGYCLSIDRISKFIKAVGIVTLWKLLYLW